MSKHVNQENWPHSEHSDTNSKRTPAPSMASRHGEPGERDVFTKTESAQAQISQETPPPLQEESFDNPKKAAPQPQPVPDYAEEFYDNSATQSYLHDSYYPHLYYEDWHETAYDETDRALDEYREAAYDAQQRYWDVSYDTQAHEPRSSSNALTWQERLVTTGGAVYQAHLGSSQLLIQDRGESASEDRYNWVLIEKNDSGYASVENGVSDSFQSAEATLLSQAEHYGLMNEHLSVQETITASKGTDRIEQQAEPSLLSDEHDYYAVIAGTAALSSAGLPSQVFLSENAPLVTPANEATTFINRSNKGPNRTDDTHQILSDSINPELLGEHPQENHGLLNDAKSTAAEHLADDTESFFSNSNHAAMAGTAALSAVGVAGHTVLSTGKAAVHTASRLASIAAHEDEDIGKMDDARHILVESVAKEIRKHPAHEDHGLLEDAKLAAMEHLLENHESNAEQRHVLTDTQQGASVADAEALFEKSKAETRIDTAESQLIDKKNDKRKVDSNENAERKPVTKRERDLAEKKKKIEEAKLDKGGQASAMLLPVKATKREVLAGVGVAKNVATSSVSKVISDENEDIATLMTMTDRTKKTARDARKLARVPQKVLHGLHLTAHFIKNAATATAHAIASVASMGWPFVVGLLLLLLVVLAVVIGSLSILNENQETSEVSALVAKLDEDLEKDIQSYGRAASGSQIVPIYYCDARGTYGNKNKKNVDLQNHKSDLQEVDASTVHVFTDPEEIIAYIDAKYEGEWQAGAASWKVTVDWNGKKYNIFSWENVPEFVQKGLNKIDEMQFKGDVEKTAEEYIIKEFYGGSKKATDEEKDFAHDLAESIADELATVIYDQQLQNVNDEVIYEIIRAGIKQHTDDMKLTDEQLKTLNYEIMADVTELAGEEEPVALVYDEIVELHSQLNYWSEDHERIMIAKPTDDSGSPREPGRGLADNDNAYGYPNSSGFEPLELEKWDGYNEVSVYGVSESGTSAVTADGTRITNRWNDPTMAIACEGLQNSDFAYWSSAYKKEHPDAEGPVHITLYNPETGAVVTAEVRDCGGWRGYNENFEGMNATRQWDVLPAVWKALGGSESAGLMNVYWRVDNEAPVSSSYVAAASEVTIEKYPWSKETDKKNDSITINRATYIRHDITDFLNNDPLLEKTIDKDSFSTEAEYQAVVDFVKFKVKDVMKPVLTAKNAEGNTYTDYMMTRRELGSPFGKSGSDPVQWVVNKRFNPGFEDSFDKDKVSVGIKPLGNNFTVYAVRKGTVSEVKDKTVTVSFYVDELTDEMITYENLKDIQVKEGDAVKTGTKLGTLADQKGSLKISWNEIYTDVHKNEHERDWAYNPALFMQGFAGYEEPKAPTEYAGGTARSLEDCETIIDFAYSRLGCPYVWGATGPDTFDCSGLTQWCYDKAGIEIPRNSEAQHDAAEKAGNIIALDESKLQPGDILWKPGHVGLYIGNNQYIHAPQTGDVVKISSNISYFECGLRFTK